MSQELAAPVRGIANAFHRGTVLTRRICKFAKNEEAAHTLHTLEPANALEKSLGQSELRVKEAYSQSMKAFGPRYANALVENHVTTGRLHALTINLLEQLNSLDEYMDDPMAFDVGSFTYIQRESERACEQAIMALGSLHKKFLDSGLQQHQIAQDDRTQLPSLRQVPAIRTRAMSQVSPMTDAPNSSQGLGILFGAEETRTRRISNSSHYEGISPVTSNGSLQPDKLLRPPLRPLGHSQSSTDRSRSIDQSAVPEPLNISEERATNSFQVAEPQLILRDEVVKQMNAVEEWLQRRQTSRDLFQEELKRVSFISMSSVSGTSPNPDSTASPTFSALTFSESPTTNSRPHSNVLSTIMETMNKPGPPVPPKDNPWDSPTIPVAQDPRKTSSGEWAQPPSGSDPVFLAPLDPPPSSHGRQSSRDETRELKLDITLKVPGFGVGVPDGIEVAGQLLVSDPGIMLADESRKPSLGLTPATSVQSVDHAVRLDSSFYKYGGFCDGAKMVLRGVGGALQEKKKPGGMYTDVLVMKCGSCSFEVGYNNFHRDRKLDAAGIIITSDFEDIRYRTRFLTKSHLKTKQSDQSLYGCMFCIEEGRTLEDQDATVFFSIPQLLRHIQKHPRRLKDVEGVKIVYGPQPESAVDFDLHFLSMEAKVSPTADVAPRLAGGAMGFAIVNHCSGAKGFKFVDPERRPSLQFAVGARIVGITYPPRFSSNWCSGYHDSVKGHFPSSAINLEPPTGEDATHNPKSSLCATARWDHRPKDSKWLSFSKKEKITHIGYPYQEFWCWSGKNAKNQWGLFPKDFVDDLIDTSSMPRPIRTASSQASFSVGGGIRNFTFGSLDTAGSPVSPVVSPSSFNENGNGMMVNSNGTIGTHFSPTTPNGGGSDGFSLRPKTSRMMGMKSMFKRSGTVRSQATTASGGSNEGEAHGGAYAHSVASGRSGSRGSIGSQDR